MTPSWQGAHCYYSECMGFWPTWNRLNSFIDIIHSTENKAIKEGTTSVNSNYKSSRVASFQGNLHKVDQKGLYEVLKIRLRSLFLRFNLSVCDNHKFLKRNLNFNFYHKLKKTPLQIDPRQKSAKTCLSSSYLVIESSRKHYVIF